MRNVKSRSRRTVAPPAGWASPDGAADVRANRPRPPLWREILLFLAVFAFYSIVSNVGGPGREVAAQRHGRDILDLERSLHIAAEEPLNEWLAPRTVLATIANYEYAITYIAGVIWLLGWLYTRRPAYYRWGRTAFVLITVIAIIMFGSYPTAPPRLLQGDAFVDTVSRGNTVGSWGSPLVDNANHLAAMPSLHVGWALWLTVVLGVVARKWWVQLLCALDIAATLFVIMGTANHYLLDAVGAAILVGLVFAAMALVVDPPGKRKPRLAPADAFFLYSEERTGAPQHVGGVIVMRYARSAAEFRVGVQPIFERTLGAMPRYRHRVDPGSFWRRPRWVPADGIDWDWHLPVHDLSGPDGSYAGREALETFIAELFEKPLPRDRPLWRYHLVSGYAPGELTVVLTVHHVVSDGMATIFTATRLFDPLPVLPSMEQPRLSVLKRTAGVTAGIAQLANDGLADRKLPWGSGQARRYGMADVAKTKVRAIAEAYGVHVSEVLIAASAGAIRRVLPPEVGGGDMRVSVPLTLREPTDQSAGNVTAAVLMDLPLGTSDEGERLREIHRRTMRLRSGTRAMGGRFVIGTATAVLPPPLQAWFAQVVYGRRFFEGIVSNMPGPKGKHVVNDGLILRVHPVVPLAPGSPLAVGIIGWDERLNIGVSADPVLMDDARPFALAVVEVIDELSQVAGLNGAKPRIRSVEEFGTFWPIHADDGTPVRKDVR